MKFLIAIVGLFAICNADIIVQRNAPYAPFVAPYTAFNPVAPALTPIVKTLAPTYFPSVIPAALPAPLPYARFALPGAGLVYPGAYPLSFATGITTIETEPKKE